MFQIYKDGIPYGGKFEEWSEAAQFAVNSDLARYVQRDSGIKAIRFCSDVDTEIKACADWS